MLLFQVYSIFKSQLKIVFLFLLSILPLVILFFLKFTSFSFGLFIVVTLVWGQGLKTNICFANFIIFWGFFSKLSDLS